MMRKSSLSAFVLFIEINSLLLVFFYLISIDNGLTNDTIENKVVVPIDPPLHKKVNPGDKPIGLRGKILNKLFPELKKPRLMQYEDLTEFDRTYFIKEGYTFILRGDFNNDDVADIAFVGKYENAVNPDQNSFFAIISIEQHKVTQEYFYLIRHDRASLLRKFMRKKPGEAILVAYEMGSDYCEIVYWTGKNYTTDSCQSVWLE